MNNLLLKSIADSLQELTEDEQVSVYGIYDILYIKQIEKIILPQDQLNDVLRRNRKLKETENVRLESGVHS